MDDADKAAPRIENVQLREGVLTLDISTEYGKRIYDHLANVSQMALNQSAKELKNG